MYECMREQRTGDANTARFGVACPPLPCAQALESEKSKWQTKFNSIRCVYWYGLCIDLGIFAFDSFLHLHFNYSNDDDATG